MWRAAALSKRFWLCWLHLFVIVVVQSYGKCYSTKKKKKRSLSLDSFVSRMQIHADAHAHTHTITTTKYNWWHRWRQLRLFCCEWSFFFFSSSFSIYACVFMCICRKSEDVLSFLCFFFQQKKKKKTQRTKRGVAEKKERLMEGTVQLHLQLAI